MQAEIEPDVTDKQQGNLLVLAALSRTLAPLSFLLLLSLALWRASPHFLETGNLKEIATQASVVAILACGQTAVIISGNIDLSIAAVMAFAGVAAADAMKYHGVNMGGGILIACLCGMGMGAISGLITGYGAIPSFIVTLGMMGVARGVGGIISGSVNIGVPDRFVNAIGGELFGNADRDGIPYAVLLMVAAAFGVHLLLTRTRWGRALYAMGGNREATRLSGIALARMTTGVFALSGLMAGLASVVQLSRASVASKDAGTGYELYAVAAAVIGGTSLFGGQGGIPGTIIGAFLIYTIYNGCALLNIGPDYQNVIIGAVVVLAVLYDRYDLGARSLNFVFSKLQRKRT